MMNFGSYGLGMIVIRTPFLPADRTLFLESKKRLRRLLNPAPLSLLLLLLLIVLLPPPLNQVLERLQVQPIEVLRS